MGVNSIIKRMCNKDTAVYWGNPSYSGAGVATFDDPVEIKCLWADEIKNIVDDKGRETVSVAKVHVTQDLDSQSVLFHGVLTDLTPAQKADPRKVPAAYEMKLFLKTPSAALSDNYNRVAML